MIDRKKPPAYGIIDKIRFPLHEQEILGNGLPMHSIQGGVHDIVRLDYSFPAGTRHATSPLTALAANQLLQEGTRKYHARELAEKLDYYGAVCKPWITSDTAGITVFTLSKHLIPVTGLVHSMITEPQFPEEELLVFLQKKKQQFLVEMERVSYRARNRFMEVLFGENHPYGRTLREDDFQLINREVLMHFWEKTYSSSRSWVLVSGKPGPSRLKDLKKKLAAIPLRTEKDPLPSFPDIESCPGKRHVIPMPRHMQSALRFGRLTFTRDHHDFPAMLVLNTILGGYFGSRLMRNIREDKGYTYGIGSFILPLHNAGYFTIVSEVGSEYTANAIAEIYREMEILQREPVRDDELDLVRNYMMGDLLRELDGPFSTAETYRNVVDAGMDMSHVLHIMETIKQITPGEIRELAQKYLSPEDMKEVIAGRADD
ncbi:MAG: M16 family metallopeptidase [Bacteroidales bacterium]